MTDRPPGLLFKQSESLSWEKSHKLFNSLLVPVGKFSFLSALYQVGRITGGATGQQGFCVLLKDTSITWMLANTGP